jgi:hypothetical protein
MPNERITTDTVDISDKRLKELQDFTEKQRELMVDKYWQLAAIKKLRFDYPGTIVACEEGLKYSPNDQRLKELLEMCKQKMRPKSE